MHLRFCFFSNSTVRLTSRDACAYLKQGSRTSTRVTFLYMYVPLLVFRFSSRRGAVQYIVFIVISLQFGIWGFAPRKKFLNQTVYNRKMPLHKIVVLETNMNFKKEFDIFCPPPPQAALLTKIRVVVFVKSRILLQYILD